MNKQSVVALPGIGVDEPIAAHKPGQKDVISDLRCPQPEVLPTQSLVEIAQLRISQDFASSDEEQIQTTIRIEKPDKNQFFRAHPNWSFPVAVIDYEQILYPVVAGLHEHLEADLTMKIMVPCITRKRVVFLWPLAWLPATGSSNPWIASAHRGLAVARKGWIRLKSNRVTGVYDIIVPKTAFPDPEWPFATMEEILEIAFGDSVISSLDHPVIKALHGEV